MRRYLSESEHGRRLRPALFRHIHATAISEETGSALPGSLRGVEVVVPLRLEAQIDAMLDQRLPPNWFEALRAALPLVRAVGAHRNRGLGRASLSLEEVK